MVAPAMPTPTLVSPTAAAASRRVLSCVRVSPRVALACRRRVLLRPTRSTPTPTAVSVEPAAVERSDTVPLLDLSSIEQREHAAAAFERVDDVVMGGVSSSRLCASPVSDALVWSGRVRVDGGGFAGVRSHRRHTGGSGPAFGHV